MSIRFTIASILILACNLQAASGPTLHLASHNGSECANPASAFMYFVPLISPEPVVTYSTASSQTVRLGPARWHVNQNSFIATCDIHFQGQGSQKTVFDLGHEIHRHEKMLLRGGELAHQLKSILVQGAGAGQLEIEGAVTNGSPSVSVVRIRFSSEPSPVQIDLCDIRYVDGTFRPVTEVIARVSTLTFRRAPGVPKMEVTVRSVKDKNAGDGLWQNLKGRIEGMAANLLIDPLPIEADGHRAMLDFGRALISGASTFTFPEARSLLHQRIE